MKESVKSVNIISTAQVHCGSYDEYKYVFHPDGFHHVNIGAKGCLTEIDRQKFVKEVYKAVKESCPNIIHEGLFRVDIMYSHSMKKLVLNELESLEAGFECNQSSNNLKITNHLNHYWNSIIANIVSNFE
jgi:hypothetical protein